MKCVLRDLRDLFEEPDDVAFSRIRIETHEEIWSGQREEVHPVRVQDRAVVERLPEQRCRPWWCDREDFVDCPRRGQMMSLWSRTADA